MSEQLFGAARFSSLSKDSKVEPHRDKSNAIMRSSHMWIKRKPYSNLVSL